MKWIYPTRRLNMKESKIKPFLPLIIICAVLIAVVAVVGVIVSTQAEKQHQEEVSQRAVEAESIANALFGEAATVETTE